VAPVRDDANAHSGRCSLRIERRAIGDCAVVCGYWSTIPIPIDTRRTYRLSVWAKGSPALAGEAALSAVLRVLDAGGRTIEARGVSGIVTEDWTEITLRRGPEANRSTDGIGPWPERTAFLVLDFAATGSPRQDGIEGDIWFDDVYFGLVK
jgi:hypothetical protein